jgi:hypothetical protein
MNLPKSNLGTEAGKADAYFCGVPQVLHDLFSQATAEQLDEWHHQVAYEIRGGKKFPVLQTWCVLHPLVCF